MGGFTAIAAEEIFMTFYRKEIRRFMFIFHVPLYFVVQNPLTKMYGNDFHAKHLHHNVMDFFPKQFPKMEWREKVCEERIMAMYSALYCHENRILPMFLRIELP